MESTWFFTCWYWREALGWGLHAPASPPPPLTDRWAWPHGRLFRGAHVNMPTAHCRHARPWAGAGASMRKRQPPIHAPHFLRPRPRWAEVPRVLSHEPRATSQLHHIPTEI
jgi:hypothetical protein